MKVGDLVREINSPQSLGVILKGKEELRSKACYIVFWFEGGDSFRELGSQLELIR